MSRHTRDRLILSLVYDKPWAILESAYLQIEQIASFHARGGRLSDEEIAETLAAVKPRDRGGQPPASVAVLPLWGTIVPHADVMSQMSGGTDLDSWREDFRALVADPSVGTIVLNIDSPGGAVDLVTETAAEVRAARSKKQIVAVANTMAASAAYAIASQADELYVSPSGIVGSIGTFMGHEDISGMLEQEGVKVTLISAPADGFKTEGNSFEPLSEEALAAKQKMVNAFQALFEADVAKGRGVDVSTVQAEYGQGRVMTAQAALRAGMVDGVASLDQVLAKLAKGGAVGRRAARASQGFVSGSGIAAGPIGVADIPATSGTVSITFNQPATLETNDHTGQEDVDDARPADEIPSATPSSAATDAVATTRKEKTMTEVIDDRPLTREELLAEQDEIKARQAELDAQAPGRAYTDQEQAEDDKLEARYEEITKVLGNLDKRRARLAAKAAGQPEIKGDGGNGTIYTNAGRHGPENIFDLAAYRAHAGSVDQLGSLWTDAAKRANEKTPYRTLKQDETRTFVEALLDTSKEKNTPHESFGHRVLMTADPAYDASFGRWVMGRETSKDMERIRATVSNTGLGSETPVPITIDPTVLYTGDGARSPLRELAQVVTITGQTWRGIGSDGVTMAYQAETAAVTPDTPDFDAPDVTVIRANGEIQFTVDVEMDWSTLRSELQRMFSQAKFRLEADKFLNGNGSNEPTGLIFALDAEGSSVFDTATTNVLALADVIAVSDELPSSFDYAASWLAHKSFYSNVAALAAAEGRIDVWVPLSAGFNQQSGNTGYALLNSQAYTASEISKLFTTGGEEVAVIGDFAQGFVIVDRVGLNVELDMHPRDTNGKWTGNRALIAYVRNNTALRTPNAFRLLRIEPS